MKKQQIGGITLILFGLITILFSIFVSDFITTLRGYLWRISLCFLGVLFTIFGVMNLFHKEH